MPLFSTLGPRSNQPPAPANNQQGLASLRKGTVNYGPISFLKGTPPRGHSTINFGMHSSSQIGDTAELHTTAQQQPNKPSFSDAFMAGAKAAFDPGSIVWDAVLGTIATVIFALIPPHIHALAVLPSWLAIGAAIRGAQGFKDAYSSPGPYQTSQIPCKTKTE